MAKTRQVSVFIDGKQVEGTMRALLAAKKKLNAEINQMTIGSKDYNETAAKISQLNNNIRQHRQEIAGTGRSYNSLQAGLGKYMKLAASAFAVTEIVAAGKELFRLGAEMELLGKKAETVFGTSLPQVTAAAEENAAAMGLTASQYTDAATAIGDLLIPMKFTRDEAANISTGLVDLSGALSEWTGGQRTAAEVSDILAKAMLGEREQLKGLGVAISEADVQNRLAEKGLKGLTGEYLQQAKAIATLELITEKSTDAQAAYAKNADTLVRRQAELTAKFEQVKEQLATALLPVFSRLVDIASNVANVFGTLGNAIENFTDPVKAATNAFNDQQTKVAGLEKDLVPLLNRYDELSEKTSLTESEQQELAKIIVRVGEITPSAITQIDQYGKALGINADQSRAFVEAERARLAFVNEESIATLSKEIDMMTKSRDALQKIVEGPRVKVIGSGADKTIINYDDAALSSMIDDIARLTNRITGAKAELDRLAGTPAALESPTATTTTTTNTTTDPAAEARAKARATAQQKELEDLARHQERLAEIIEGYNEENRLSLLDEEARKLEEIRLSYDKQITLAKELEAKGVQGATDQRIELERLQAEALDKQQQEFAEKNIERINAEFEAEQQAIAANLQARIDAENEIKQATDEVLLSDREQAIQQLEEYYNRLRFLAEEHGLEMNTIDEAYRKQKEKLDKEFQEKTLAEQNQVLQKQAQALQSAFAGIGTIVSGLYDVFAAAGAENTALGRILALAEIGFNSAKAVSAAIAAGAGVPFPGNLGAMATGIGAVVSGIAQATAILNSTPKVEQRYTGGYFGVTGQDDGRSYNAQYIGHQPSGLLPNRPVLLASERGREYLIAAPDLRNPAVLDHVRAIENIRQSRTTANRVPQFAEGGFTGASVTLAPSNSLAPAASQNESMLLPILERLTLLLDTLETRGVRATLEDTTLLDARSRTAELLEAGGGVG